jgi:GMP synthase (glutamine-hydrolysing)
MKLALITLSKIDVQAFVDNQVKEIKSTLGNERALVAVSGGVDSTVSAVLTHRAIGDNLVCVFIDDNFMRLGEPDRVKSVLSSHPLNLPVKVLDEKQRFMKALKGLSDAEEKRKAFRETFYETLSDAARSEGCIYLVQGTIRADIEETKGGIKTQHNILEQIGIDPNERFGFKVIEPVAALYKYQVRDVARYLGAPQELSERQPFPGPGLSVRVVGNITTEKLDQLKTATDVVEKELQEEGGAQYFVAIMDGDLSNAPDGLSLIATEALNLDPSKLRAKILKEKATGVVMGDRTYGLVAAIETRDSEDKPLEYSYENLEVMQKNIQSKFQKVSRVLYLITQSDNIQEYTISIRAVETQDYLTAEISKIPWDILIHSAQKIIRRCQKVSRVYYDITPKPPATIEYE